MVTVESTRARRPRDVAADRVDVGAPPRSSVVIVFAVIGTASLTIAAQAMIRWVLSSDFTPAIKGPDPIPRNHLVMLRAFEFTSFGIGLAMIGWFLVRPLIRERRLTLDGTLVIAGFTGWWMDPLVNYFNLSGTYNAYAINRGSWVNFIPGWSSPNAQHYGEPILGIGFGAWVWWILGGSLIGCAVLREVKKRRPQIGNLGLLAVSFLFFAVLDFVFESIVVWIGVWTYAGGVKGWMAWQGRQYQFPIYEPIVIGVFCTGLTAIRWYRDDRGRSIVERGVDDLRTGPRGKKLMSVLAVIGAAHLSALTALGMWQSWALKQNTFAPMPSYLREGICGTGTDYACPGAGVPIPSRSSYHLRPDDPHLSPEGRAQQGTNR